MGGLSQVCEGELGFADLGVVQLVTAPLALERISVFYISTFNTDFGALRQWGRRAQCVSDLTCRTAVLVRDADLGRTLACLRREFLAQVEGDDAADASEATAPAPTPTAPLPVLTQQRESGGVALSPLEQEGPRTQLAPMNMMPVALHIARMPKDSVPMHTHMLLRLYCSPRAEDDAMPGVLSFTETEDEVSLVFPHMEWVLDYMAGYADLVCCPLAHERALVCVCACVYVVLTTPARVCIAAMLADCVAAHMDTAADCRDAGSDRAWHCQRAFPASHGRRPAHVLPLHLPHSQCSPHHTPL